MFLTITFSVLALMASGTSTWSFLHHSLIDSSLSLFPSASPTLRRVQWRVLTWTRRWPPCWAWWWRGWSRARTWAPAVNPTAAPPSATRCRRLESGGRALVDLKHRQPLVSRLLPVTLWFEKLLVWEAAGLWSLTKVPAVGKTEEQL